MSDTERLVSLAMQLIARYGVVTRSLARGENVTGGFAGLYPVLKSLEESGKVRRGYFVAGLGGAQFAAHGAEHELRQTGGDQEPVPLLLAATDPANPYGTALPWPRCEPPAMRPQRAAGGRVILLDGELLGYLGKTERQLTTFLPTEESQRGRAQLALVEGVAQLAAESDPVYLTHVDGMAPGDSVLATTLIAHGFVPTTRGYLLRGANRRETQNARG